jgi:hypothetical protein
MAKGKPSSDEIVALVVPIAEPMPEVATSTMDEKDDDWKLKTLVVLSSDGAGPSELAGEIAEVVVKPTTIKKESKTKQAAAEKKVVDLTKEEDVKTKDGKRQCIANTKQSGYLVRCSRGASYGPLCLTHFQMKLAAIALRKAEQKKDDDDDKKKKDAKKLEEDTAEMNELMGGTTL